MTQELFREDAYLTTCDATVISHVNGEQGVGVILDQTVFYPEGGGQPGDIGTLTHLNAGSINILDTRKSEGGIVHWLAEGVVAPAVGETVTVTLDWERRHKLMRMHTAMHLLCSIVDGDVTGGQVGAEKSRLDFNLPDTQLDKEALTASLNALVAANKSLSARWITDEEMAAQPDLVRTMSVKPPSGSGHVRLMDIDGVDLQPCGGPHVHATGEIGALRVGKIENKGRQNRRINIHFAD